MNGQLARKLRKRIFGARKELNGKKVPGYLFRRYEYVGRTRIADELRRSYQAFKSQLSRGGG